MKNFKQYSVTRFKFFLLKIKQIAIMNKIMRSLQFFKSFASFKKSGVLKNEVNVPLNAFDRLKNCYKV